MKNCTLQKQLTRKTRRKKGFNRTPFCQKKRQKKKKGEKNFKEHTLVLIGWKKIQK